MEDALISSASRKRKSMDGEMIVSKEMLTAVQYAATCLMLVPFLTCVFDNIPNEVLAIIFGYIPEMWPVLALVCKRFHMVLKKLPCFLLSCSDLLITPKLFQGENQERMIVWAAKNFPMWTQRILDFAAKFGNESTISKLISLEMQCGGGTSYICSILTFDRVINALRNNRNVLGAAKMWISYINALMVGWQSFDFDVWFSLLNEDYKQCFVEAIIIGCRYQIINMLLYETSYARSPFYIIGLFNMFAFDVKDSFELNQYFQSLSYICYSTRIDYLLDYLIINYYAFDHCMSKILCKFIEIGHPGRLRYIIESPMVVKSMCRFVSISSINYRVIMNRLAYTMVYTAAKVGKLEMLQYLWFYVIKFFNEAISYTIVINIQFDSNEFENFLKIAALLPEKTELGDIPPCHVDDNEPGFYRIEEHTPSRVNWNIINFLWPYYAQVGIRESSVYVFNRVARCCTIQEMDILASNGCFINPTTSLEVIAKYGTVEKLIWTNDTYPEGLTIDTQTLTHALRIRKGKHGNNLVEDQDMIRFIVVNNALNVAVTPTHRNVIRRIFDPEFYTTIGISPASFYGNLNSENPDEELAPEFEEEQNPFINSYNNNNYDDDDDSGDGSDGSDGGDSSDCGDGDDVVEGVYINPQTNCDETA